MYTKRSVVPVVISFLALMTACTTEPDPRPAPTPLPVEVEAEEAQQPTHVGDEPADCSVLLEQYKAEFAAFYADGGAFADGGDATNDELAAAQDRHVEMSGSLVEHDCYLEFEEYGQFAIGVAKGDEQGG